jgi:transposase InsO family protein
MARHVRDLAANFSVKFEYIRGTDNAMADALSRTPTATTSEAASPVVACPVPIADATVAAILPPGYGSGFALEKDILRASTTQAGYRWSGLVLQRLIRSVWVTVPPRDLRPAAILAAHKATSHRGVAQTLTHLRGTHWWPGMPRDVSAWLANCPSCLAMRVPRHAQLPQLRRDPTDIGDRWAMDVVGPLPETGGKRFMLVAVEAASRFAKCWALGSVPADAVVSAVADICGRYGAPAELMADNGPAFDSAELRQFCEGLGTKLSFTTPYHPRANGGVERLNGTLLASLRKASWRQGGSWVDVLPSVVDTYNRAQHSATGEAPDDVLHKRIDAGRLRAALQNGFQARVGKPRLCPGAVGTEQLAIDSWVLIPTLSPTKLDPRWTGPHRIVGKGDHNVYLVDVGFTQPRRLARDQIFPIPNVGRYRYCETVLFGRG